MEGYILHPPQMPKKILVVQPNEYATFPINGEPDLTINHCGLQQMWSAGLVLHHVLDDRGNIKYFNNFGATVCPLEMENDAMVKAI